MEAGQRYYVITDLRTNEIIENSDGEVMRFKLEGDALLIIDGLVEEENGGDYEDYRIDCLRW